MEAISQVAGKPQKNTISNDDYTNDKISLALHCIALAKMAMPLNFNLVDCVLSSAAVEMAAFGGR